MISKIIGLLFTGITTVGFAASTQVNTCPDMTNFNGTLPVNWHVRHNEPIKSPSKNQFIAVIVETTVANKNNIYCRYRNEEGGNFVLSSAIPTGRELQSIGSFWKYDDTDKIWECSAPMRQEPISITQCTFTLK